MISYSWKVLLIFCTLSECDGGTYGFMCSEVCGECKSKQTCHTVNGKCQSGCKPGFYGDLCKMRMYKYYFLIKYSSKHPQSNSKRTYALWWLPDT